MTSQDTRDTERGTPAPCSACPGPEGCYAARSATLTGAYVAGCRSDAAREANRQKAAQRRARAAGTGGGGGGSAWDAPDSPPGAREPTGGACAECGEPMYWEPGRAGQRCDNNHWEIAPETTGRIIPKPTREVSRDKKPSIKERALFGVRRDELIYSCEKALAEVDVTGIETLCARFYINTGWDAAQTRIYVSGFRTIISEARQAQTYDQIEDC